MILQRSLVRCILLHCILVGVVVLTPQLGRAIGFQPVSQDELHITGEPKAPGAAAIILYRQVDRDDNGHTSHEDNYFRIKILTEEGRKYADVEIPYSRDNEEVVNVHARTIRPDGSTVDLRGKVFDKTIVKGRGIKYLAKTFTLSDVQPGSIIEYYYTIDYSEEWLFDSHWIISNELFTKRATFTLKPYSGYYSNFRLTWRWQGIKDKPTEGANKVVRLEVSDIEAFETEDYMPPENELKARVDFIYSDDPVQETEQGRYWKRAGKKLNGNLESFAGKHKAMEEAVAQIVAPSDSPEEKARKIYARVQQIRNLSYEVARTEQEKKRNNEKDINNVEDLWKRGYGSGYQITWLYYALAKAAGLDAYGVMVADRGNYFFRPVILDERRVTSNVVMIHFKDKDVFCDPGSAYIPFGLLPWTETGVNGLKLDKDGGQWVETSLPDSNTSQIFRKATLKLDPDTGGLEGKIVVTYTGLEAATRRVEERNEDDAARKKYLEDDLRSFIPVAAEAELVNKPEWRGSADQLVAEFDVKIPGWAESAGRRAMMQVGLFGANYKHVFDHAHRVHQLYFSYPTSRKDDITIALPEGWRVSSVPPAANRDQKVIAFNSKVESDGKSLHISRRFNTDILLMEVKYYPALQDFYGEMRSTDEQQIVLQPAAN